jgi:hypothetical protein
VTEYKFIEILKSFSKAELERFKEFLDCSYFNSSDMQKKLFGTLYSMHPSYNAGKEVKETLGRALYGKDYKDNNLRKLLFGFTKLLEKFILLELAKSRRLDEKTRLLLFYRERKLNKNFSLLYNSVNEEMNDSDLKNVGFYYDKASIEKELFNFETDNLKISLHNCEQIIEDTNLFFVLSNLELYYNVIKYRDTYNKNSYVEMPFFNEVLGYVKKNEALIKKEHPNIYTSYIALMTLVEPANAKHYKSLKQYLKVNEKKLAPVLVKDIFVILYNYACNKLNKGHNSFRAELFDIMKGLDERGLTAGIFTAFDLYFLSVVHVGISLNRHEWVEYFIDKYEKDVPKASRADLVNICRANLYFHRRDFDSALGLLAKIKHHNELYYVQSNIIIFKIYFEKNEIEAMFSLYDAIKHFLKRNEHISPHLMASYDKLIRYTLKLAKLNGDGFGLKKLKEAVENENVVNSKDWLMEKIEMHGVPK